MSMLEHADGITPEVPGDRTPNSCLRIADARERLLTDGWAIVADDNRHLGFDPTFRQYACETYFGAAGILTPESYDVFPPDRKRARGVVEISFGDEGDTELRDIPQVAVVNEDRGVRSGERIYKQTPLAGDERFRHWLARLAELVPPPVLNYDFYTTLTGIEDDPAAPTSAALRRLGGGIGFLVGVNLFEINRDVVSGPHQDNTCWNAITVIDKHGEGATSQLYRLDSSEPFLEYTLAPGQTLIINDRRFRHSATPLQPAADGISYRRTIVCTFDPCVRT